MLRRKPTAIAVTSEDIAGFENARLHNLAKENRDDNKRTSGSSAEASKFDPSDELKPLPGDKAKIVRSREDRVGIRRQA